MDYTVAGLYISQPATLINITGVGINNCGTGIQLNDDADGIQIRNTQITNSRSNGISVAPRETVGKVLLDDVSVCHSGENDIRFFRMETKIGDVNVTGDLTCNRASNFVAFDDRKDITSEYCTMECPVSFITWNAIRMRLYLRLYGIFALINRI